jgi:glycine betaine/proline transport system substrate-binding protein
MGMILDGGMEPEKAARKWLQEHPAVLDTWLEEVTTVDGQPGLPAVKAHLGL